MRTVAEADINKKRWYVLQVYSGYEKIVKQALQEKVKRSNLEDGFGKILVPTEEIIELKGGEQRTSERKFYPGYVLIEMVMNDENWHFVKSISKKVLGFVGGTSKNPSPIAAKE